MNITPEEAWCIGFFEGEGTIAIDKTNDGVNRHSGGLSVCSTDKDIIDRFLGIVGKGYINGPYWNKASTKPYWQWLLCKQKELIVLLPLWIPYLGERRKNRAELLLTHINAAQRFSRYCPNGHEYTPENTYIKKREEKYGFRTWRSCRRCNADRQKLVREKRKLNLAN